MASRFESRAFYYNTRHKASSSPESEWSWKSHCLPTATCRLQIWKRVASFALTAQSLRRTAFFPISVCSIFHPAFSTPTFFSQLGSWLHLIVWAPCISPLEDSARFLIYLMSPFWHPFQREPSMANMLWSNIQFLSVIFVDSSPSLNLSIDIALSFTST